MKSITKFLLIGTIAVVAIAMSAAPSDAAKRKRAAASGSCSDAGLCAAPCNAQSCGIMICDWHQKKWVPTAMECLAGQCPNKC